MLLILFLLIILVMLGRGTGLIEFIVILLIILLWYAYSMGHYHSSNAYIFGVWVGDDMFCHESGLDMFSICLSKSNDGKINCWLLGIENKEEKFNQLTKVDINYQSYNKNDDIIYNIKYFRNNK